MKRLCSICARGDSKGVKGKNIRNLLGKPLISHSIEQAKQSALFEKIAVSSDSDEILAIAEKWKADILIKRPDELATETAAKLPVIKHCVEETEKRLKKTFDLIVDLDVTSPLRTIEDIKRAVYLLEGKKGSNVISGTPSHRSPYFNLVEVGEDQTVRLVKTASSPIIRRQDAPKTYDLNASIYGWKREQLFQMRTLFGEKTLLYIMPEERSIDIDTELDFFIVESLMKRRYTSNE